jgi:hypothetical protein
VRVVEAVAALHLSLVALEPPAIQKGKVDDARRRSLARLDAFEEGRALLNSAWTCKVAIQLAVYAVLLSSSTATSGASSVSWTALSAASTSAARVPSLCMAAWAAALTPPGCVG